MDENLLCLCLMLLNFIFALFHQPFRSRCGSANADSVDVLKPTEVNVRWIVNHVSLVVDSKAFVEEHLSVGTFLAAHEEYHVVSLCKFSDVWHAVGYLSADGVEVFELCTWLHAARYVAYYLAETFKRFCGLREELYIM